MLDRPYTLLSCALSIDGYLDSAAPRRLELSNDADFDRVDSVRASCDAILVGAATVRNDNPRLLVRSRARRDERTARGLAPSPIKITVTENTRVSISGVDKKLVGQVAADIRRYYPPEPYKGKGVRYADEIIRRKEGKTVQ